MGSMSLDKIIEGFVIFLTIDLLFRQGLSRLDTNAKMRIESLSSCIRPALRLIEEMKCLNKYNKEQHSKLLNLVEQIKPLPPKNILEKVKRLESDSANIGFGYAITEVAKLLFDFFWRERNFVAFYSSAFGVMAVPAGFSMCIVLVVFTLPHLWLPSLILSVMGKLDWWITAILLIIAVVFEVLFRKKGNKVVI